MDLSDSSEDKAFRAEVRAWLEDNLVGDFAALKGLGGPEMDQGRAEQLLAEVVDPRRRVRTGVLLVEDHLLHEGQPAAAVLGRPADAGPAVLRQVPVPLEALVVRLQVLARPTQPLEVGEPACEVVLEPGSHLGPEGPVLGGIGQVHVRASLAQVFV